MSEQFLWLTACVCAVAFLFGICSACCVGKGCLTFEDDFAIAPGRLVSWPAGTHAFDEEFGPIVLGAGRGTVRAVVGFGGSGYALVEYDDGGTPRRAYIPLGDLTKELDEWWVVCSGDWSIKNNRLESGSSGTMTFLPTAPTSYGIFTAEVEPIEDAEYVMYVKRGEVPDPCGPAGLTIRWRHNFAGDWTVFADGRAIGVFSPGDPVEIGVCIDEKGVAVIFDGGRVYQICSVPGGSYFAIGAGSGVPTRWGPFRYSDHHDHDPQCPRCQPSCCFPNDSETIEGFDITITGIEDGLDCQCGRTLELYVPLLVNGLCACGVAGEVEIAYPGGGFFACQSTNVYVTLLCDTTGVFLGIDVTPNLGTFSNWNQGFAPGTAPRDVRIVNRPVDSANEGFACDYGNAVLSAIPRVTTGCCGGEPGGNPLP